MKNNSKNKISIENLNFIARSDDLPQLIELVKQLEDADKYQYFHQNVDEEEYPDYYTEIKYPMCFQTLREKYFLDRNINENQIKNFYFDLLLIWTNCWEYNTDDSDISKTAEDLAKLANRFIKKNILSQNSSKKLFVKEKNSSDCGSSQGKNKFLDSNEYQTIVKVINKNIDQEINTNTNFINKNENHKYLLNETSGDKDPDIGIKNSTQNEKEINTELKTNLQFFASFNNEQNLRTYQSNLQRNKIEDNINNEEEDVKNKNNNNKYFNIIDTNNGNTILHLKESVNKEKIDDEKIIQEGVISSKMEDEKQNIIERKEKIDNKLNNERINEEIEEDINLFFSAENFSIEPLSENAKESYNQYKIQSQKEKNNSFEENIEQSYIIEREYNVINNKPDLKQEAEVNNEKRETYSDKVEFTFESDFKDIIKKIENEAATNVQNDLQKESFANDNEKISQKIQYFGDDAKIFENCESKNNQITKKPRYIKSLKEKAVDLQDDIINFTNRVPNKNLDFNNRQTADAIFHKRERKQVDYLNKDISRIFKNNKLVKSSLFLVKPIARENKLNNYKKINIEKQMESRNSQEKFYNFKFKSEKIGIINQKESLKKNLNILNSDNTCNAKLLTCNKEKHIDKNIKIIKSIHEKSLNGLDPYTETFCKRIPRKPQKYADEDFESENINITGISRHKDYLYTTNRENFSDQLILKPKTNRELSLHEKVIRDSEEEDQSEQYSEENESEILDVFLKKISPGILKYKDVSYNELINTIKRMRYLSKMSLKSIILGLNQNFKECISRNSNLYIINFTNFNKEAIELVN